jgi:nucleobase:cation symporter-1, NCS1 family
MVGIGERAGRSRDITAVPQAERVLSGVDLAVLWGDLGIGLLVLVTGALLVPGLGLAAALGAIVAGSIVGAALLGLAGAAGAQAAVPTMVLFRPVLGRRGSWLPSLLNALQLVGWTAVEFWAMSFVADIVVRRAFGLSARPLWLILAALVCTGLALWGPVGVTRLWMKRFSAWIVTGVCLLLTAMLVVDGDLGASLAARAAGGFPSFGAAFDLVIAMPVSWLPLVADYNRFARRPATAFIGTFGGYLVANVWLYTLGALLVLEQGAAPSPAGIAAAIVALAGGTFAGIVFLAALIVGETDEAFADMYSGALSLRNIWPRLPQRAVTVSIAAVASLLAAWLSMARYESFLFLLGSVFVPLFGILGADYLVRRRHTGSTRRERVSTNVTDSSNETFGVRLRALVPWLAGFVVYHWIAPSGPAWWLKLVSSIAGDPLGERFTWLGASIPSFVAAFALAVLVSRAEHRA